MPSGVGHAGLLSRLPVKNRVWQVRDERVGRTPPTRDEGKEVTEGNLGFPLYRDIPPKRSGLRRETIGFLLFVGRRGPSEGERRTHAAAICSSRAARTCASSRSMRRIR